MTVEEPLPDFTSKIVILYLKGTTLQTDGFVLESATFQRYGDRLFIVGRGASIPQYWAANVHVEVEWGSVHGFLIFDTLDDYLQRSSMYQPTLLERIKRFFS